MPLLCEGDPVTTHLCPDGDTRRGDEFDCGFCRAWLLGAFRTAPQPHLIVPDPGRTVALGPSPVREHVLDYGTEPDPDQPGGDWYASCSCGWSETGRYVRDGGQPMAERLASIKANEHRKNPEDDHA